VSAIHASCNMIVRKPIANGDLNINGDYTAVMCCQDLQNILEASFAQFMNLKADKVKQFYCILVLPDNFVKHHVRYLLDLLFGKMGFKAIFVHTESVMATYAMAA